MSFIKEIKDKKGLVKIEGAMSIYEAATLREAWMECFETCEAMEIDLRDVTDCDITGVQLIYSARMTAEATEKGFEITAVSPAVTEALAAAGLNPEI